MSLREVWHLCNLPCVYAFFWLVSISSYVFWSSFLVSKYLLFQETKYEINREDVVYLHSLLWRRAQLWLELFASTVVDYHTISYLSSYMFLRRCPSFTLSSEKFPNSNKLQLAHREYNPNTVKKWNNRSALCIIYDSIYARSGWSADSSAGSVFRQTVGMDPGYNLFTFPSMWNNLVKMFRTNHEPAFRIEIFFGVSFPFQVPCLLATNASRRMRWITQEHAENNNYMYLVVFRRSKYTHFSQQKLPLCILN